MAELPRVRLTQLAGGAYTVGFYPHYRGDAPRVC